MSTIYKKKDYTCGSDNNMDESKYSGYAIRMKVVDKIVKDSFNVMYEHCMDMQCPFYVNKLNECLLDEIKTEWNQRNIKYNIERPYIIIDGKECIKIILSWFK